MKKMQCIDCDEWFEAETKEAMMQVMHPHYMEKHQDVMAAANEEKKKAWFEEFNKRWEEAEEV